MNRPTTNEVAGSSAVYSMIGNYQIKFKLHQSTLDDTDTHYANNPALGSPR